MLILRDVQTAAWDGYAEDDPGLPELKDAVGPTGHTWSHIAGSAGETLEAVRAAIVEPNKEVTARQLTDVLASLSRMRKRLDGAIAGVVDMARHRGMIRCVLVTQLVEDSDLQMEDYELAIAGRSGKGGHRHVSVSHEWGARSDEDVLAWFAMAYRLERPEDFRVEVVLLPGVAQP